MANLRPMDDVPIGWQLSIATQYQELSATPLEIIKELEPYIDLARELNKMNTGVDEFLWALSHSPPSDATAHQLSKKAIKYASDWQLSATARSHAEVVLKIALIRIYHNRNGKRGIAIGQMQDALRFLSLVITLRHNKSRLDVSCARNKDKAHLKSSVFLAIHLR